MRSMLFTQVVVILVVAATSVQSQSFSSGSNGSDGALNLTTPGTVVFDPKALNLDLDADNVYHFTTINIGVGVTVKLSEQKIIGPVFWLAQGAVTIAGTLDLNGSNGYNPSSSSANRYPSVPGPGGYGGGVGLFGSSPAQAGFGPGGGKGAYCGFFNGPSFGQSGGFTGNVFLVPLLGGSGGGGGGTGGGPGGGAGGGAILIASSASIAVSGAISSVGGQGGTCSGCAQGGSGSGGAIRLAALSISGSGQLNAAGGPSNGCGGPGGLGGVRIEAFQDTFTGLISGGVSRATPFNLFVPIAQPSVRVVSVAGVPVPPSPTGDFVLPDVTINSAVGVPFAIEARNIPVGTVVKIQIFSENGLDQTVDASALAGTLQLSTATATALLPSGFSHGMVRATWTQ